jgi:hypothetical protein
MQLRQLIFFLKLENEFNVNNLDIFEEIAKNNWGNTIFQNLLNRNQIIDDKSKPIIISLGESFIVKLFIDKHYKEYNFPTLFFGYPRPSFECSYQKIVQAKLTRINKKMHIPYKKHIFETIKNLIPLKLSSTWIHVQK